MNVLLFLPIFLLGFVVTACTTGQKVSRVIPLTTQSWPLINSSSGICLTAEGKGKGFLSLGKGRKEKKVQFNYESLFQTDGQWLIALDIPLHGEEYLSFKKNTSEISVSGTLMDKISQFPPAIKSMGKLFFLLKEWMELEESQKMKIFADYEKRCLSSLDIDKANCFWDFKGIQFKYFQDSLKVQYQNVELRWLHWIPELMKFDSQNWKIFEKGQRDTEGESMHLELWPEKCI